MMRLADGQSKTSHSNESEQVENITPSTDHTTLIDTMSSTGKQPASNESSSTTPASASAIDIPMNEGTRTTMDDDNQLQDEVTCVFVKRLAKVELISKQLAKVEHRLRLCDWELAKEDRRRHWDDAERLRPPRKLPLNDNFLDNNNPLLGLRDDRDYRNPEQRP